MGVARGPDQNLSGEQRMPSVLSASVFRTIGGALLVAVPGWVGARSLRRPGRICKWACVILGITYSGIMAVTLPGSKPFYTTLGAIEIALTLTIAIIAFRWPRGRP